MKIQMINLLIENDYIIDEKIPWKDIDIDQRKIYQMLNVMKYLKRR